MFIFDACTAHQQGLNTPFLLAEQLSTFGCALLAYNLLLLFVETQQGNVLLVRVPHDSCVRAVFLNYLGVWWLWYNWRTNVIGQVRLFSELSQPQLSLFTVHTITASHKSWGCESEAALDWSNVTCMLKEHDWSKVI